MLYWSDIIKIFYATQLLRSPFSADDNALLAFQRIFGSAGSALAQAFDYEAFFKSRPATVKPAATSQPDNSVDVLLKQLSADKPRNDAVPTNSKQSGSYDYGTRSGETSRWWHILERVGDSKYYNELRSIRYAARLRSDFTKTEFVLVSAASISVPLGGCYIADRLRPMPKWIVCDARDMVRQSHGYYACAVPIALPVSLLDTSAKPPAMIKGTTDRCTK